MADVAEFFSSFLPAKLAKGITGASGIYVFDIGGAGTWTLNIDEGSVTEGGHEAPGCKITADKATWEQVLDNPSKAVQLFMMGKIKATNIGMATKLQAILS